MHSADHLLEALALVLGAAAITTVFVRLLRQPVVLGYVIAGFLIGPHFPATLVKDASTVTTLSELGVVLLMFFLGLEFTLGKLIKVGAGIVVTAVVETSLLFWLGFASGRMFGWPTLECVFTGAIVAISSTTIIVKAFEELGVGGKVRDLVVGILVVEDVIAILLIAVLTALATGTQVSTTALASTVGRLGAFLIALVAFGVLIIPRAVRALTRRARPETVVVAVTAFSFGLALLARQAGYSVALGAFLAGTLVAESGQAAAIRRSIRPLRDVFGAVFFVSIGMMIDPALIVRYWLPILVLSVVVVLGKIAGVSLGAFFTGHGTRTSLKAGMSLAQIGELSFIIAGLGVTTHAAEAFLFPVAVAVSSVTTLLTPWSMAASGPVASFVDRKLPGRLQTFASLYGSWLERTRSGEGTSETGRKVRRLARMLVIDGAMLAIVVIGMSVGASRLRSLLAERLNVAPDVTGIVLALSIAVLSTPLVIGIIRVSRRLATTLAQAAFPGGDGGSLDLAALPRRALRIGLELAALLLVGTPLVAVTQPFLHGFHAAELALLFVIVAAAAIWQTTAELQGHVRAGTQVVIEALSRKTGAPTPAEAVPLAAVFAGLGEPVAVEVPPTSPAVDRTLAELDLRGVTGATVLAITRGEEAVVMPSSHERIRAHDRLAIAGTRDALDAARVLLEAGPSSADTMRAVLAGAGPRAHATTGRRHRPWPPDRRPRRRRPRGVPTP